MGPRRIAIFRSSQVLVQVRILTGMGSTYQPQQMSVWITFRLLFLGLNYGSKNCCCWVNNCLNAPLWNGGLCIFWADFEDGFGKMTISASSALNLCQNSGIHKCVSLSGGSVGIHQVLQNYLQVDNLVFLVVAKSDGTLSVRKSDFTK